MYCSPVRNEVPIMASIPPLPSGAVDRSSTGASIRLARLVLLLLLLLGSAAAARNLKASQHCDLCEHNWLFILSAGGRTGSTTALSMLNAIPGVELEGENAGALLHLADFAEAMERTNRTRGYAWHSRVPDYHGIKCEMQEMVRHMLLGHDFEPLDGRIRVLGFKEIRYTTPEMLKFLSALFPCARFVLNFRQHVDAEVRAQEFKWGNMQGHWAHGLELFRTFHEAFPSTTAELPTEELTVDTFNNVLHRLLGVQGCRYATVLHENSNGGYTADNHSGASPLEGVCDLSGVNFRLSEAELENQLEALESLWAEPWRSVAGQQPIPRSSVDS